MRNVTKKLRALMLFTVSMFLLVSFGFAQQTVLLTESFESGNGTTPPAGWSLEQVSGSTLGVSFVTSSTHPTVSTAYDGTRFVMYNSYNISSGSTRLKRTTAMNTMNKAYVMVDFAWFEDPAYSGSNDRVDVQWSTNGTTWNTAATYPRYNAVAGWKVKNLMLPTGANNQGTLYVAFMFTSDFGNNCSLDLVHVTCGPMPAPIFVTLGTGTSTSPYPYTTFWMGGRTQMLYKASDLIAAGATAGTLNSLGFNVSSFSSQVMNNFAIKMGQTTSTTLTSYVSGLTTYYNTAYAVPGTGWRDITLTTPFVWNGTSNVIIDICFANTSYTSYSYVYGATAASNIVGHYADTQTECTTTTNSGPSYLPNIRFGVPAPPKGVLNGYVRDINTLAVIPGAIVKIPAQTLTDTARANGYYVLYNVNAGTANVSITAPGYIATTTTAAIVAGSVTTIDLLMSPGPKVGGTVTDASTGLPINGATVTVGTATTPDAMTIANGTYLSSLLSVAGPQTVHFSKTGYITADVVANLVPNTTVTVDAALLPEAVQPGPFTAVLNNPTTPTAVNLNWGIPQGMYQIIYDDGTPDNFAIWGTGGNLNALKFTPLSWPVKIIGGKVNLGTAANYPANALPLNTFTMFVCKADGAGGTPGTLLDSLDVTPTGFGWAEFNCTVPLTLTSGDFYLVMKQGGIPPHAAGIGVDLTNTALRSYSKYVTGGAPWIPAAGNFMMRAIVQGVGGPTDNATANKELITASAVEGLIYESPVSTVTGYEGVADYPAITPTYQVWRLLQGQEGNQTLWTSLWTGATNSTVDNGWPSLANGPYRWAVKAIYTPPGQRFSAPTFSNVIGKGWTANVDVCVTLTCAANPKAGTVVTLTNTAYPDTTYTKTTDTSGCVHFTNVWKGDYTLKTTRFTYPVTTQPITVMGDMNVTVTMLQNTTPPTGLYVNDKSLLATWFAPRATVLQLDENWSSGSFATNQWTTSGGSNWGIGTGTGNPAPSAEFNYSPTVTNYNQFLTSKIMAGVHAPAMLLNYDIYLDNYGTTNVNTMAVELWNGTTWTVLKTYTNANGSITWTSESLNITTVTHSPAFQIRFHAAGADSYDINNWNIDNIKVVSTDGTSGPNPCVLGYNFYLNNVQAFYTPDTSYVIPANLLVYNTTYQACVKAVYGSGYSAANCTTFVAHFLYPARNLVATGIECNTYLTWEKPVTMGDAPGDNQAYAPVNGVQPVADISMNPGVATGTPVSKSLSEGTDAATAILFDNGPLVNSPGTGAGGADESVTFAPLTTYGFGAQQASGNSMADDFIVPPASTWNPTKFTFYTYQTGGTIGSSSITGLYFRIYDGDPTAGGNVIWGDMTTNRMTATSWSSIYRTTAVGGATDRPIMKVEADVTGITLPAGTYWVEFQFTGSLSSGPWAPPISITGTNVTGNGKQHLSSGWQNAMDGSYQQGLPFLIEGPGGGGGGGATPVGLVGYRVYRDNTAIKTIMDPDTLDYYDYNLNPGTYKYDVKALYDLTSYGIATPPAAWGESLVNTAGLKSVTLNCGTPLPFYEPWDAGTFAFNNWAYPATTNHWSVNTGIGDPAPCADFTWQTALANYSQAMTSEVIDASAWTCAAVWLDFDVKLLDRNATGKEKLTIDVFYNGSWHQKMEVTNDGSTNWVSKHIDISSVKGKSFRIRFVANGVNSADMLHWYVDNIHAYGICKAPTTLAGTQSQFTTTLTWHAPDCGPSGNGTVMVYIFDDGTWENGWRGLSGALDWYGNEFPVASTANGVIQKVSVYFVDNGSGSLQTLSIDIFSETHVLLGSSAPFSAGPVDTWIDVPMADIPFTGKFFAMVKFDNPPAAPFFLASDENGPYTAQDLGWNQDGASGVWAKVSTLGANPCVFFMRVTALVSGDKKSVELSPSIPMPAGVKGAPKGEQAQAHVSGDSHNYQKMGPLHVAASDSSVLTGYNVYRTDDSGAGPFSKITVNPVTALTYADVHPSTTPIGSKWQYFVTTLFLNSADQTVLCEASSDTIMVNFPAVGVNEIGNGQIMIYPNPATEFVNVKSDYTITRVDVLNFAGQTVYTNSNVDAKTTKLDVTALTVGVYFVKVSTTEGVRTVKITVTH